MQKATILKRIKMLGDKEKTQVLQRFFKTGPGQYGAGDVFAGLTMPEIRKLAKEYQELPFSEAAKLLRCPIHEARMLALLILIRTYQRGEASLQEQIFRLYLENTRFINSWDLVDISAEHIVGAHLKNHGKALLATLASSGLLWERRIAVMATFNYIKHGEFADTLHIAKILLGDKEDLIHKAVGWMLREIGKRDRQVEEKFLQAYYKIMPRTMLRYAIEKFPEKLRQKYLKGEI